MPKDKRKNTRKDAKAKATCNRCDKPPGGGVDEGRDNGHGAHPSPTSPTTFHIPPTSYHCTLKLQHGMATDDPATHTTDHYHWTTSTLRSTYGGQANDWKHFGSSAIKPVGLTLQEQADDCLSERVSFRKRLSELENNHSRMNDRQNSLYNSVQAIERKLAPKKPHDESRLGDATFGAILGAILTLLVCAMVSCAQ